ncbi:hypothetical protein BMI76_02585 [Streptococcus sp. 'caviae']|nr:hypothetical protein BMI76_02585 [Streptococcus sp. 'caviae']
MIRMQSVILGLIGLVFGALGLGLLCYSFSGSWMMTIGGAIIGGLLAGFAGYSIHTPISWL